MPFTMFVTDLQCYCNRPNNSQFLLVQLILEVDLIPEVDLILQIKPLPVFVVEPVPVFIRFKQL